MHNSSTSILSKCKGNMYMPGLHGNWCNLLGKLYSHLKPYFGLQRIVTAYFLSSQRHKRLHWWLNEPESIWRGVLVIEILFVVQTLYLATNLDTEKKIWIVFSYWRGCIWILDKIKCWHPWVIPSMYSRLQCCQLSYVVARSDYKMESLATRKII